MEKFLSFCHFPLLLLLATADEAYGMNVKWKRKKKKKKQSTKVGIVLFHNCSQRILPLLKSFDEM